MMLVAVSATIMAVWVVEPSAMRLLGGWLHGPELHKRGGLDRAPGLWRIHVRVDDTPGRLESLAKQLAQHGANILTLHIHHLDHGALDELIVATPTGVTQSDLAAALSRAGGSVVRVWPASRLMLIDGQTKALALAARVVTNPSELPLAIAELLRAHYRAAADPIEDDRAERAAAATTRKIRSPAGIPLVFTRRAEPFTPAEIARAHCLSDLAHRAAQGYAATLRQQSFRDRSVATHPARA